MPTLVRDPPPAGFAALLERRRRLGQDLFDEVWEGVLHMNPALHSQHGRLEWQLAGILAPLAASAGLRSLGQFNLGEEGDYRVPDGALVRPGPDAVYLATAALVLEIVSPGDETWEKLDFYAAHGVDELLIVDPQQKTVSWMGARGRRVQASEAKPADRAGCRRARRADRLALAPESGSLARGRREEHHRRRSIRRSDDVPRLVAEAALRAG
jgi:hypothetical protein